MKWLNLREALEVHHLLKEGCPDGWWVISGGVIGATVFHERTVEVIFITGILCF